MKIKNNHQQLGVVMANTKYRFWSSKSQCHACLVVQWLSIHLPMQKTWVQSLIQEGPTCCTQPTYAPQLLSPCSGAQETQLLCAIEPTLYKRGHHNEKPMHHNWWAAPLAPTREKPAEKRRPAQLKINKNKIIYKKVNAKVTRWGVPEVAGKSKESTDPL